ncbi:helix-turn-helix domain-containing protein [Streptomyces fulvoviolaceus]|uniref:helix-turn-helix domain-containing protein n=1 Tax=Streptomyces fulvoviolaceus TaxID=285535 RepID=UPI0007C4C578|nr:helix-turn-helix domain-containing protein [Streptomyces fulvoviolaceus]
MNRRAEGRELATALRGLKDRSGLSYQVLGQRIFISGSTLHRYCTGQGVPGDYDIVLRFAKECGAEPAELNDLLRYWEAATEEGTDPGPLTAVPAGAESWSQAPLPVAPEMFGVTMNSFSGVMPSFRVGTVRLWDSETRWSQLEPRRGEFDWTTLDRLLDGAERQGLSTVFVLGGTPGWAAPDGRRAAYREDSRAAPPDDLADWDAFVRAVVRHAGGRIDAYEPWITANHGHHYNGSVETLAEMTRRASRIIREHDKDATVVCPSITDLWEDASHEYLLRFAEAGAYQYCDAAAVNLYQRSVTDPPETMLEIVRKVERTFQLAGYHLPLWNTGTVQTIQLNDPLDADTAADHAVRFYLTGLYSRIVERMYFYAWGNSKIPLVVQAEGQAPTKAGLHVDRLQKWLARAEIRSCGHGAEIGLPENVWQCEFLVPDEHGIPHPARIRWTLSGTADVRAGAGAYRVDHLDGTTRETGAEDAVRITERPLLVRYR